MAVSYACCIPAAFLLFSAMVLSFLSSVSLPFIPALDIVQTNLSGQTADGSLGLSQVRFGIWGPCFYDLSGNPTCVKAGQGYNVTITDANGDSAVIESGWTRGLVIQPVAAIATFLSFFFSLFSTCCFMPIISSLIAFLAAVVTLIAFVLNVALFVLIRNQMNNLGTGIETTVGPGFWVSLASLLILLIGGCVVCFGHRRARNSTSANNMNTNSRKGRN